MAFVACAPMAKKTLAFLLCAAFCTQVAEGQSLCSTFTCTAGGDYLGGGDGSGITCSDPCTDAQCCVSCGNTDGANGEYSCVASGIVLKSTADSEFCGGGGCDDATCCHEVKCGNSFTCTGMPVGSSSAAATHTRADIADVVCTSDPCSDADCCANCGDVDAATSASTPAAFACGTGNSGVAAFGAPADINAILCSATVCSAAECCVSCGNTDGAGGDFSCTGSNTLKTGFESIYCAADPCEEMECCDSTTTTTTTMMMTTTTTEDEDEDESTTTTAMMNTTEEMTTTEAMNTNTTMAATTTTTEATAGVTTTTTTTATQMVQVATATGTFTLTMPASVDVASFASNAAVKVQLAKAVADYLTNVANVEGVTWEDVTIDSVTVVTRRRRLQMGGDVDVAYTIAVRSAAAQTAIASAMATDTATALTEFTAKVNAALAADSTTSGFSTTGVSGLTVQVMAVDATTEGSTTVSSGGDGSGSIHASLAGVVALVSAALASLA